jgi:hypothetical protein
MVADIDRDHSYDIYHTASLKKTEVFCYETPKNAIETNRAKQPREKEKKRREQKTHFV